METITKKTLRVSTGSTLETISGLSFQLFRKLPEFSAPGGEITQLI